MSGTVAAPPARPSHRRITAIGVALLVALAVPVGTSERWNARLQGAWFDTYQVARPRAIGLLPETVVEIDEKSLARLGQWPWPRTLLAELIGAILQQKPAAVGVDILMSEPDRLSPELVLARARAQDPVLAERLGTLPSNDDVLARAIAGQPVVLGFVEAPEPTGRTLRGPAVVVTNLGPPGEPKSTPGIPAIAAANTNIEALDAAAAGHGALSIGPPDRVVRRIPLVMRIGDRIVPSLAVELFRVALGAPDIRVSADGADVRSVAIGDFVVPTERDGGLRLHFSRHDPGRFVSAVDVLEHKIEPRGLAGQLVLVGSTALALGDSHATPVSPAMPGIEIHAQALENLGDESWLSRPRWAPQAELALFALLGLTLVIVTPRLKPGRGALAAAACIALPLLAGAAAFGAGRLVLDGATPALALLLLYVALLVLTLGDAAHERRRLEQAVQRQREDAARVAGELDAARRIQQGFLPGTDTLRGEPRVDVAATMTPARETGGDLYDFFMLDGRRLFFMVGDVAGKGLSASVFMAVSKALCKSATLRAPNAAIGALMRAANDEISRDNPAMLFVAAFAGVLDLESGHLDYSNAGHENPYVVAPAPRPLEQLADGDGPPLCAVPDFDYRGGSRRLGPGELLCVVTDGVVDARNPAGERFGRARLEAGLLRWQAGPGTAQAFVDTLLADVRAFTANAEPADDVTVLALRWLRPSIGA